MPEIKAEDNPYIFFGAIKDKGSIHVDFMELSSLLGEQVKNSTEPTSKEIARAMREVATATDMQGKAITMGGFTDHELAAFVAAMTERLERLGKLPDALPTSPPASASHPRYPEPISN